MAGYPYSPALKIRHRLDRGNARQMAAGAASSCRDKMYFRLTKPEDRADVIGYLKERA